jgi:hypothetical protein
MTSNLTQRLIQLEDLIPETNVVATIAILFEFLHEICLKAMFSITIDLPNDLGLLYSARCSDDLETK